MVDNLYVVTGHKMDMTIPHRNLDYVHFVDNCMVEQNHHVLGFEGISHQVRGCDMALVQG